MAWSTWLIFIMIIVIVEVNFFQSTNNKFIVAWKRVNFKTAKFVGNVRINRMPVGKNWFCVGPRSRRVSRLIINSISHILLVLLAGIDNHFTFTHFHYLSIQFSLHYTRGVSNPSLLAWWMWRMLEYFRWLTWKSRSQIFAIRAYLTNLSSLYDKLHYFPD